MLIGAEVIDPQFFGPRGLGCGLFVEEKYVGFHAPCVEDSCRQAKQSVDVEFLEKSLADCLACTTLEQNVVWKDDGCPSIDIHDRLDVLHKIQLLVRCRNPEIRTQNGEIVSRHTPVFRDKGV